MWIVFIVSSFISLYNFDHFFLKTLVTCHKGPIERMTLHISHDLLTAMDVNKLVDEGKRRLRFMVSMGIGVMPSLIFSADPSSLLIRTIRTVLHL